MPEIASSTGNEPPEGYVEHREEKTRYLPPIQRLKLPKTRTQTALVRWLHALGYKIVDIHHGTGIRYQQVRNMVTTQPKRASREDLPPLTIELQELVDDVEALLDSELDKQMMAQRGQARRAQARQVGTEEDEGDPLDNEDYHDPT